MKPMRGSAASRRRTRAQQILFNLLSNALKFTPAGGRVHVEAVPINDGIKVSVADTGIGIARENQQLIFEELRQVQSDQSGKREGTGLGLALTRCLVELHGGSIWVESATGQGSTFTFTLRGAPGVTQGAKWDVASVRE